MTIALAWLLGWSIVPYTQRLWITGIALVLRIRLKLRLWYMD